MFDFIPRFCIIAVKSFYHTYYSTSSNYAYHYDQSMLLYDGAKSYGKSNAVIGEATVTGNTLTWYHTSGIQYQANTEGKEYFYIAFG